jgi:hypothetical protein
LLAVMPSAFSFFAWMCGSASGIAFTKYNWVSPLSVAIVAGPPPL